MIQLSYQPAFDPLHTIFRLLRLLSAIEAPNGFALNTIRIVDFYLLFPFRLSDFRFMQKDGRYRKLAKQYEASKPYGDQPEGKQLLEKMEVIQTAAIQTLATKGFISASKLQAGIVVATDQKIEPEFLARLLAANEKDSFLLECLTVLALQYPVTGENGLKARSGLLEYRYDPL